MEITKGFLYHCDICGKNFLEREHLTHHQIDHLKDDPLLNIAYVPILNNIAYLCRYCDKTFLLEESVKAHIRNHNDAACLHLCIYCNKTFEFDSQVRNHVCLHPSKQKLYICTYCDKYFECESRLKFHMRCHTGEEPYRCNQRDKTFSSNHILKNHYRSKAHLKVKAQLRIIDTGEKQYQYKKCDKDSPKNSITHNEEYPCQGRISKNTASDAVLFLGEPLNEVQDRSTGQKNEAISINNTVCDTPYKSTVRKFSIEQHISKDNSKNVNGPSFDIHSRVAQKLFQCNCGQIFFENKHLENHLISHIKEYYMCPHCFEIFSDRLSLATHQRMTHKLNKTYKCDYCEWTCLYEDKIIDHMKIHYENSPISCIQCEQVLPEKLMLENGVVSNEYVKCRKEKIYNCKECTKHLDNLPHLKRRLIMYKENCKCTHCHWISQNFSKHKGLWKHNVTKKNYDMICKKKIYTCIECNMSSSIKSNLKRHMKSEAHLKTTQAIDVTYCCKLCDQVFLSEYDLANHFLTHNREIPYQGRLYDKTASIIGSHLGEPIEKEQCGSLEIKDEPIESENIVCDVGKTRREKIIANDLDIYDFNKLKVEIKEEHRDDEHSNTDNNVEARVEGEWIINWI